MTNQNLKILLATGVAKPGSSWEYIMFIKKIEELQVDYTQMRDDYEKVISLCLPNGWDTDTIANGTNIHLRGDNFLDTTINIKSHTDDTSWEAMLKSMSFWNEQTPNYTSNIIDELSELVGKKFIRARYLCQGPAAGYPVHVDSSTRYHFPIVTNPYSFLASVSEDDTIHPVHLPTGNHFYEVDTLSKHFVYNAGAEPRVHLVIS